MFEMDVSFFGVSRYGVSTSLIYSSMPHCLHSLYVSVLCVASCALICDISEDSSVDHHMYHVCGYVHGNCQQLAYLLFDLGLYV